MRYLIVANQTLGGEPLAEKIGEFLETGPCDFYLVVPATPPQDHLTFTEGEAESLAGARLEEALKRLAEMGAEASGEVGDPNPIQAIEDVLDREKFDEIVLSTLPPGLSKWLGQDLLSKVERAFSLPVTHIIGEAAQ